MLRINLGHQADGSFTGAFVGMAASDCNGEAKTAKFEYFVYRPGTCDPFDDSCIER